MAYKKPQIIAKSDAKQTFVGGCPEKKCWGGCSGENLRCMCGNLK